MRLLVLVSIVLLCGCADQRAVTLPSAWIRANGQPTDAQLLNIDTMDCRDQTQDADGTASGKVDKNAVVGDFVTCMHAHGYVQIKS